MIIGDFEEDCEFLLNKIKKMNLFTVGNRVPLNKGKRPISCVYGYTKFSKNGGKSHLKKKESDILGLYETKLKTEYPEMEQYFKDFSLFYLGDFEFNQVVINKNFEITRHIDGKNVGESYILGLGDYQGGELVVEENKNIKKLIDIKNYPYRFNGSKQFHYVLPFQGDRYSLVFYNIDFPVSSSKNK